MAKAAKESLPTIGLDRRLMKPRSLNSLMKLRVVLGSGRLGRPGSRAVSVGQRWDRVLLLTVPCVHIACTYSRWVHQFLVYRIREPDIEGCGSKGRWSQL